jgi:hypothetical protein
MGCHRKAGQEGTWLLFVSSNLYRLKRVSTKCIAVVSGFAGQRAIAFAWFSLEFQICPWLVISSAFSNLCSSYTAHGL